MKWSRYNLLFCSTKFGHFIYNALSNAFIELDEEHYQELERLRDGRQPASGLDNTFLTFLQRQKILVGEGDEQAELSRRYLQRQALSLDRRHLALTICPTLGCNFRCHYCFERTQGSGTVMSDRTMGRLISFIREFRGADSLSITWYGGEPTLAFGVVRQITRRVRELGIKFKDAGLITNGYLLGSRIISELNDLNIKSVQITLDGPERIHDKRRVLRGGGQTFQQIMGNIASLMDSAYEGACSIRVNVDRDNMSAFFELREALLEQHRGKKLVVYAGQIESGRGQKIASSCRVCEEEWLDFALQQFRKVRSDGHGGIYPKGKMFNICSANNAGSFVVGPRGELYKCWEDVGNQELVVGTIHADEVITNPHLVALYESGTDPYLDGDCTSCAVFPICSGGCANKRLRTKFFGEDGAEFCSLHKKNLITLLLESYDAFLTETLCADLLNAHNGPAHRTPYRTIRSEAGKAETGPFTSVDQFKNADESSCFIE